MTYNLPKVYTTVPRIAWIDGLDETFWLILNELNI